MLKEELEKILTDPQAPPHKRGGAWILLREMIPEYTQSSYLREMGLNFYTCKNWVILSKVQSILKTSVHQNQARIIYTLIDRPYLLREAWKRIKGLDYHKREDRQKARAIVAELQKHSLPPPPTGFCKEGHDLALTASLKTENGKAYWRCKKCTTIAAASRKTMKKYYRGKVEPQGNGEPC